MYLVPAIWSAPASAYAEGVGVGQIGGFLSLVWIGLFIAPVAIPAMALVSLRLNRNLDNRWVALWASVNATLGVLVFLAVVIGFLVQGGFLFVVTIMLVSLCSFLSVSMVLVVQWMMLSRDRDKLR
jgi:ABC-type Co2+ transport system permease subunit